MASGQPAAHYWQSGRWNVSDLLAEFLLDLVAEGWLPHPFTQHRTDRCAWCGARADRAVHDRWFAEQRGLTPGRVLVSASGSTPTEGDA